MPGVILNPQINNRGAYMDTMPMGQDPTAYGKVYDDYIAKGWTYTGDPSTGGWSAPKAYSDQATAFAGGRGPMPSAGGGASLSPGGAGVTSLATGQSVAGPYSGTAQMAQARSEFDRIMKQGMGQLNEAAALSGGFSGGIPFDKRQQFITDTTNQENSSLERIMNDIMGRNQSYALDQQRLKDQEEARKMDAIYGGGGYSSKQDTYNDTHGGYSSKGSGNDYQGGGGGAGYNETGGGGPGVLDPRYAGDPTQGIEPTRAPGESSYDFYARMDAYHARMRKGF